MDKADQDLIEELSIMTLDIIGIFDPTGVADIASGTLSAKRGDWWSAGISAISLVPFLGDLAKAGKLGKYGRTVHKVIRRAMTNPAFRRSAEGALRALWEVVQKIDVRHLPTSIAEPLAKIQADLGRFFKEGMTRVSGKVDWQVLEVKGQQSLLRPGRGPNKGRMVSAGSVVPEFARIRVGQRVWDIGRDSTKLAKDGKPKGNIFKHFPDRSARVPQHSRAHHGAMMEEGMVHAMAEFERQWLTGTLKGIDGKTFAPKEKGYFFVNIDGWELGVFTDKGAAFRLQHVDLK